MSHDKLRAKQRLLLLLLLFTKKRSMNTDNPTILPLW